MIEPRLPGSVEFAARGRADRRHLFVDPRGLGLRRAHRPGLPGRQDVVDQARNVCRAIGFAHSGAAGNVGVESGRTFRRAFHLGRRHVGAAGDGGLARCPVSQTGADHAGNHRDHPNGQPCRAARACRRDLPAATPGQPRRRAATLVRPGHVPVYVAAMGPQNLRLTGELADGWLGNAFIPEAAEVFLGPLREGAQRAGRTLDQLDLVAPVAVEFHDDQADADAAARRHADGYAFTIGAMGSVVRRQELLQRRVHPTGLRGRNHRRRRTVASRKARRGPPRGATRPRPTHQSARHPRRDR